MSIDLTLDRIRQVAQYLPPYTRPTCHVAGTNGKGSVSAILSSIFASAQPPLTVGRFNSPHLVSVYDSIVINGRDVTPKEYESAKSSVEKAAADYNLSVSSFELHTMTALMLFEQSAVDIVVLEVGMGGRLDATNIIPDSSVVISMLATVDFDHQAFLGNSITEIAKEKASIARKNKPFILGAQKYPEVEGIVRDVVAEAGGELLSSLKVGRRAWGALANDGPETMPFSMSNLDSTPAPQPVRVALPCFPQELFALLPLHGDHQLENLGLALAAISSLLTHTSCRRMRFSERITSESVSNGIRSVIWPGRLSFHKFNLSRTSRLSILADGAHNAGSSTTLANYITDLMSLPNSPSSISLTYILALSHSPPKTPLHTLMPLLPPKTVTGTKVDLGVALVRFSPPETMPWVKSVPPSDLKQVVEEIAPAARIWTGEDVSDALRWAASREKESEVHLVVVAGSLYLVADLYRLISSQN
ncbi:Mur ligase [Mycena floridula]|nr:Mur ligase [Mycena floridula]